MLEQVLLNIKHVLNSMHAGLQYIMVLLKSLPSSSVICIVVFGPSLTLLAMEGLLKERSYCSMVSRATVSFVIVKLGSPWDWDPCAANIITSFTLRPDILTVEGWLPGPKVTLY